MNTASTLIIIYLIRMLINSIVKNVIIYPLLCKRFSILSTDSMIVYSFVTYPFKNTMHALKRAYGKNTNPYWYLARIK